ncbi:hypothetical protein COCVIDRAFT_103680 [Bipolaris victoriae FI3]|uniref:Uncharacterized protein n=2 Tax=Bipolaris TaxID=33194 RepID=W6XYN0_COCC2|nr:uncharacterized protein COCCADRAFT_102837 [Bipolaris zeicola 26-R-13]XP_014554928.1 hypothetical protein COCVIDRAFT_103680 [Bipolaris victoriae FI3]EUC30838.1 hypothetical protein COCCADRAFT_102837 [Bipolaris zeicola 26-R-13]
MATGAERGIFVARARERKQGLGPFALRLAAKGHELDLQWTADSSYARLKRRIKSKGTNGRGWVVSSQSEGRRLGEV